jgi:hypothetical protein
MILENEVRKGNTKEYLQSMDEKGCRSSISRGSRCSRPSNPESVLDSESNRCRSKKGSCFNLSSEGRLLRVSFDSVPMLLLL